jgi:C4-dicarboxylate-specific signal transduction histidine kinase
METREAAVIGRLIAGMTHEMKNVLAIIKESSGLLQDILRLKKGNAMPKAEQIEKAASRIQAQVARGNEQLAAINWLAHSMSDRGSSVGVNELSSEIVNLMQRFARLEQVQLELQETDRDVTLDVDVVRLLFALVTCIEYCLNRESPKGRVVLRPGGSGEEAILKIAAGPVDESQATRKIEGGESHLPPELAHLEPFLAPLGTRLAFAEAGAGTEIQLILPSRKGEDRQP